MIKKIYQQPLAKCIKAETQLLQNGSLIVNKSDDVVTNSDGSVQFSRNNMWDDDE